MNSKNLSLNFWGAQTVIYKLVLAQIPFSWSWSQFLILILPQYSQQRKKSTTQYHFHPHWQKVKSKLWSEPFKGLFVAELLVSGSTLKSHKVVSHSPVRDRGTYKDWVACIPCLCHTMLKQCITSRTSLSYQLIPMAWIYALSTSKLVYNWDCPCG